ncbi:MAG: aldo/keto reductase [Gammaproteobacteria bacterium]|nr:aldo/keto reductase [Gammaproteobacteria bacterium]MCP4090530.1 aldo/keto reductase [Gammaproteobacteria bacterium]MCP4276605.1 aldo/keto reductase [Gammaproteobacteria bacterium]MCP4831329.1 aldo/keto reductase [Gammaproteobacteria bacterium]
MKYKILGRSGLRVSELCLGAMTFGEELGTGASEAVSRQIYDAYREAGGNFVDTANIYTLGTSESMTGRFIAPERDKIVLASKYSMATNRQDPNASGNNRKNMVQGLEASLKRLNTEYLDLFWVHGWDQITRIDEIMRGLDDLIRAGKVLHIGISNFPAWLIAQANTLATERGLTPFTAVQMHYNLVERSIETDFFDLCKAQDMALLPWSPLAGGLLTGKFNPEAESKADVDARLNKAAYGPAMLAEQRIRIAQGLAEQAKTVGCTPSQLALAWLLHRPEGTVIPLLGARKLEQFKDNLGCLDIQLNQAQIYALDVLAPPPVTYPASLFQTDFYRQMMHGDAEVSPLSR